MVEVILYVLLGMFLVLFVLKRAAGSDKEKRLQRRDKLSLRKHRLSRKELEEEENEDDDDDTEAQADKRWGR